MGMFTRVEGKLGRMRKAQSFVVMPTSDEGQLIVQSDKSIGRFDMRTGEGILNTRGCYFVHLSRAAGAEPYSFPPEFVAAALEACPSLDGESTIGGVTFAHTVQVVR